MSVYMCSLQIDSKWDHVHVQLDLLRPQNSFDNNIFAICSLEMKACWYRHDYKTVLFFIVLCLNLYLNVIKSHS